MKNQQLHQSEELAKHFANYRDEAPLLSAPQIEKLLAERDMLPNQSTKSINVRRIIMTLSGITGLATVAYFAFFSAGSQRTERNYVAQGTLPQKQQTISIIDSAQPQKQTIKQTAIKNNGNGPWGAGNDINYADLSVEELARLGIVVKGDTVIAYKLPADDTLESIQLTTHSIGGGNAMTTLPPGIHASSYFPILMTHSNGHGAAYVIEKNGRTKEWGMIGDNEIEKQFRDWLEKPGTPGYYALGFTRSEEFTDNDKRLHDKVTLSIAKGFPQPRFLPFMPPGIRGYSDTVMKALVDLGRYYDGNIATKPTIVWPESLTIKVDTITPKEMLAQLDSEENSSSMQHLHSIMDRINELVPVRVYTNPSNKDSSFILWYEPSEELFAALPEPVAKAERARLAEPPHCLNTPDAVLTTAEITYCESEPQKVHISVRDLTGKERIWRDDDAVAGDNVAKFSTATLASGMYLVTVLNADSTERTRRIWVENANPKKPGWETEGMKPNFESVSYDADSTLDDGSAAILAMPHLELDQVSLASIGIRSNDSLGGFYRAEGKYGNVACTELLRKWNPQERIYSQKVVQIGGTRTEFLKDSNISGVTPQKFYPRFVTNGKGSRRVFFNDSVTKTTTDTAANLRKFRDIDRQFREIDQLIPILLRADNTSDSVGARDLIFWYKPTPEFLATLSDSARNVVQAMIGGNGNNSSASVADVHGAISKAVAYPNPSKGRFSVDMTLDAPRTLTFTLRNLLGQQVAPPVTVHSEGESTQPLDFESAGEGVYLLDITSDSGERFVQRIVIAR